MAAAILESFCRVVEVPEAWMIYQLPEIRGPRALPNSISGFGLNICMGVAPSFGGGAKSRLVFRPIVQRRRIEIRAAGPHDGVNLRIKRDLREHRLVTQRSVKLALKNRLQINGSHQIVIEAQAQRIRRDVLAGCDAINGVFHDVLLRQGSNRRRFSALLQQYPIGEQLVRVQFGPSLDEPLLTLRERTDDECDG